MNNAYQKWLAGEGCCNAHNFINIETPDCDKHDVCDCENILLEISKLHTDDEILQEEIDAISGETLDAYTKEETDELLSEKLDVSAYTPTDLTNYYTKIESDGRFQPIGDYLTKESGDTLYQPIGNYLTEHQPLKTINGNVISGTGNIEITCSGGSITVDNHLDSASTNPVANSAITEALNGKLDASAYTPTEQVQSDWNVTDSASTAYIKNKPTIPSLNGYATEQWVLDKHYISGVDLSDYALKSEIPTVPTSNSAFTNDEHFITSGDSVFNNYATTANTYTKTEVNTLISNKIWCGTQQEYDALQNKQNDVLYLIHS